MVKKKAKSLYNLPGGWVPQKTVKVQDPLFHNLTVLDKWSKKIPKKLPVALSLKYGTDVPTHSFSTGRFIPQ